VVSCYSLTIQLFGEMKRQIFTDRSSGPDKAIGLLCVCLCVWTRTSELNDRWPQYFASWFRLTLYRSCLKVKVIDRKFTVTWWKCSFFGYGSASRAGVFSECMLGRDVFLFVCRVLRVKVVGATSSEGFLGSSQNIRIVLIGYAQSCLPHHY